jgi:hypothetical protein
VDLDKRQLPTGRDTPTTNSQPEGDRAEYCRQLESYLCRKNDGHLIRIVGPAFEQVCGWAARGVPLKVAYRGIDRYFDRYYAKGPRRRPVRIEFCEADVLDVFDEWRRAVGVPAAAATDRLPPDPGPDVAPAEHTGRHVSLSAHLARVIARLTALRAGADRSLDLLIDDAVRELDAATAGAKVLRGAAREELLARLRTLDATLIDAARSRCDAGTLQQLGAEAEMELAPFRERMPPAAYEQSHRACVDRLVRERAHLPNVAFE